MAKDDVFSEFKLLGYFQSKKEVGTFPFYPQNGQMPLEPGSEKPRPIAATVTANIEAWFNEDRKLILILLSYGIDADRDKVSAVDQFQKANDIEQFPGAIMEATTVQGVLATDLAYDHATKQFDLWKGVVRGYATKAEDAFNPFEGDLVTVDGNKITIEVVDPVANGKHSKNGKNKSKGG